MHRDDLFLEFVRVVENAAIAAARTMGQGDRKYSDQVAVEAMRKDMETVDIDGTIVIGEGERDEAPMLFIGEKVGKGGFAVDIAVDPLEGTNLCATGRRQRHRRARRVREGRPAERPRHLHGQARGGPELAGEGRHQRPRGAEPEGHRQGPRPRRQRPRGHRPRPAAPRAPDRRDPQDGRPHPADRGRRPVGRASPRPWSAPASTRSWARAARPKAS